MTAAIRRTKRYGDRTEVQNRTLTMQPGLVTGLLGPNGAVGLQDVADKRSGGCSLGMGQRLGIASAPRAHPRSLILDEPVNGLDPEGIRWIRELLGDFAVQGRTVLVSSHLMSELVLTADHVIVVGRGEPLADMPMAKLIAQASTNVVLVRRRTPTAWPEVWSDQTSR